MGFVALLPWKIRFADSKLSHCLAGEKSVAKHVEII